MTNATVRFRRKRPAGFVVNFWIRYPVTGWAKLRFRNDQARATLAAGTEYALFWDALGKEGDELTVERKIEGVDGDFKPLLAKWKLPDDPDTPPGVPARYRDRIDFKL